MADFGCGALVAGKNVLGGFPIPWGGGGPGGGGTTGPPGFQIPEPDDPPPGPPPGYKPPGGPGGGEGGGNPLVDCVCRISNALPGAGEPVPMSGGGIDPEDIDPDPEPPSIYWRCVPDSDPHVCDEHDQGPGWGNEPDCLANWDEGECGGPDPDLWYCVGQFHCEKGEDIGTEPHGNTGYTNEAECTANSNEPGECALWHCTSETVCEQSATEGTFSTEVECLANANDPNSSYNCIEEEEEFFVCTDAESCVSCDDDPGACEGAGTLYDSWTECIADAEVNCPKWECNPETGNCFQSSQGTYLTQGECEENCDEDDPPQPPCEELEWKLAQTCVNIGAPLLDPGHNPAWVEALAAAHEQAASTDPPGEVTIDVDENGEAAENLGAGCEPDPDSPTKCCSDKDAEGFLNVTCCPDVRIRVSTNCDSEPLSYKLGRFVERSLTRLRGGGETMMPNTGPVITSSRGKLTLDLKDPAITNYISTNYPTALQDQRVVVDPVYTAPSNPTPIINTGSTSVFKKRVHPSIEYTKNINGTYNDWDSSPVYDLLPTENIIKSLKPQALRILSRIKHFDGELLRPAQIAEIIRTRIIDGTINSLDMGVLKSISKQKTEPIKIIPSRSGVVNTVAALNLLENNKIPIDPTGELSRPLRIPGRPGATERQEQVAKLTKVLATDISKAVPITINGEIKKFFIGDDDVVIDRTNITIEDGDYINIRADSTLYKLFLTSELDHAYVADPLYLRQVERLLGGTGGQTFSVSAMYDSNIEFDYSIDKKWENFYFATLVPSSVESLATIKTPYLGKTKATYEIMDHTTTEGLAAINSLIKYRINGASQTIHYDDIMLHYMTSGGEFSVTREDFVDNAPKNNKTKPIFPRQLPWYYIIFPTNKEEYLTFATKSTIQSITDGIVTRTLPTAPLLYRKPGNALAYPPWIKVELIGTSEVDVYGQPLSVPNPALKVSLDPGAAIFKTGYKEGEGQQPTLSKTTFRVIKEIIENLSDNYVLEREGIGYILNKSDVFFRLAGEEYNKGMILENFVYLLPKIEDGLIKNIKLVQPTRNSGPNPLTRIMARKTTFTEDKFPPIRSLNTKGFLVPPYEYVLPPATTKFNSSTLGAPPADAKTKARAARR